MAVLDWRQGMAVVQLVFLLLTSFQKLQGTLVLDNIKGISQSRGGVQLIPIDHRHVVLSNGMVNITLTVPDGEISAVNFRGSDNLLSTGLRESERGHWNVVWNKQPSSDNMIDGLKGTTYKIIEQNENQVEVSFSKLWRSDSSSVPLNIDKRYVILKDSPGFYSYAIFERQRGWPNYSIQEGRLVFKLQEDKFHYMAMSDERQSLMPQAKDRTRGQPLEFKEAVLLTNPSNPAFRGEVDDKYMYSCNNKDSQVHGWVSSDLTPIGFWMITPSNEFRTGGPLKQDLTSHVGPTTLSMFISRHYAGEDIDLKFGKDEYWKKVIGPVFVYLNSNPLAKKNPSILWDDAKQMMKKESGSWPYNFPNSKDFLKSNQRGAIFGKLLVKDRFKNEQAVPAASAFVGLATPGPIGSWQLESKGYQFWTSTDERGNFLIKNVIPGVYSMFAWVNGVLGEYKHHTNITITPGSVVRAEDVVFEPPRRGPTLWEIGIPDRTAAEFFVPNPSSQFRIHAYRGNHIQKFQQYGLWKRYNSIYPKSDLVFTIGTSDYEKDWFYAHVPREVQPEQYVATTWQIQFDLTNVDKRTNYTLQLALASATYVNIKVHINDMKSRPDFMTGNIGGDNAIVRYGDHGVYRLYSIDVKRSMLVAGKNIIFFTAGNGKYSGVLYDYIRLEAGFP